MMRRSFPLVSVFLVLALLSCRGWAQTGVSSNSAQATTNDLSGYGQTKTKTSGAETEKARKIRLSESGQETDSERLPASLSFATDTPDPKYRLAVWGGSVTAVNVGLKMASHRYYAIVSVGGVNLHGNIGQALAYGLQFGLQFPVNSVYAAVDAGYAFMDNKELFKSSQGAHDQHIVSIRGSLGIRISRQISFFMGTGMIYTLIYGKKYYKGEVSPQFFTGFELF